MSEFKGPIKPGEARNPTGIGGFKAGDIANPRGKTKETRMREIANAEKASRIQERFLDTVLDEIGPDRDANAIIQHIRSDVIRLIQDAMDRGYGKPVQSIDMSSEDGSMSPKSAEYGDAVLNALAAKHGKPDT